MVKIILAVLLFTSAANAEVNEAAEWSWTMLDDGGGAAWTKNSRNNEFGVLCSVDACRYYIRAGITCEGDDIPALVNTDIGGTGILLECAPKYDGSNPLVIKNGLDIDGIVKNALKIRFAIAMKNTKFKVTTFSLHGSSKAISSMQHEVMRNRNEESDEVFL